MKEIQDFLESNGYKLRSLGNGYWTTNAKFRGGEKITSLSVHQQTGWFKDWVTGATGSFKDLITLVTGQGNLTDEKLKELIQRVEDQERPVQKIQMNAKLDKEVLTGLLPDYRFFNKRFISEDTQKLFGIGFESSGKMRNRYVVPIFCHKTNNLVGLSGRDYRDKPPGDTIKWKHLNPSSSFLFPMYLNDKIIREKKEIIIVESIGDLLALWEMGKKNTICGFGAKASSKIINYITGIYDLKKVWISFNEDRGVNKELAGNTGALKLKQKLSKLIDGDKIKIVFPPEKCNDWSDYWVKKNLTKQ